MLGGVIQNEWIRGQGSLVVSREFKPGETNEF